jgi:membrane protease YdiL (CAAX protease family)
MNEVLQVKFVGINSPILPLILPLVVLLSFKIFNNFVDDVGRDCLMIFSSIFFNSISEEFIFRAILLGAFAFWIPKILLIGNKTHHLTKNKLNSAVTMLTVFGLIFSSFIFALQHNPNSYPITFVMGLVYGWLYITYKNLLPAMVAHSWNNFLAFVLTSH